MASTSMYFISDMLQKLHKGLGKKWKHLTNSFLIQTFENYNAWEFSKWKLHLVLVSMHPTQVLQMCKSKVDKMMSADSEVLLMEVKQGREFNMNNNKPSN